MKSNSIKWTIFLSFVFLLSAFGFSPAETLKPNRNTKSATGKSAPQIEEKNVRAHMEFLASDALQGRGSGTQFELIAGKYFASQMQQFGIEPAGDANASGKKEYIQTVNITQNTFAEPPKITYSLNGKNITLEHGKEMLIWRLNSPNVKGGFQKIKDGEIPEKGSIAFVKAVSEDGQISRESLGNLMNSDAAAILIEETPQWRESWERFASRNISFTNFSNSAKNPSTAMIIISKAAADSLSQIPEGTQIKIGGKLDEPKTRQTWNSVGMIKGTDPRLSSEVILLSAHMDHLGFRENAPGDDKIFNGADDDASGCVAVIELARILANGDRPKRTVYFAFFGSEEAGGFGSRYFVENLPFPKEKLVANLQFEMIGRPDEKVAADELWLTGYDRSNLGIELTKHGAKLVNDPHPEQNFFQRSDNYTLARQGIIAHTVSSYGLHTDYHHASDEIGKIDFEHMTRSINSMIKPLQWLVNSDFKPTWYEGKKP